jgi:hypothetical protein
MNKEQLAWYMADKEKIDAKLTTLHTKGIDEGI